MKKLKYNEKSFKVTLHSILFDIGKYLKSTDINKFEDFECCDFFGGFSPKYDLANIRENHFICKKLKFLFFIFQK